MQTEKRARPNRCELTDEWVYEDEHGRPRMRIRRFNDPNSSRGKRYRTSRRTETGWAGGAPSDKDRLLYRLPELLAVVGERRGRILICEGERDCDALLDELVYSSLPHTATTNAFAAGGLTPGQASWFKGFPGRIYIVLDNDDAGARIGWTRRTALLRHASLSPSQITFLAPQQDCKDADEHLRAGYTLGEFLRVPKRRVERRAELAIVKESKGRRGSYFMEPPTAQELSEYRSRKAEQ